MCGALKEKKYDFLELKQMIYTNDTATEKVKFIAEAGKSRFTCFVSRSTLLNLCPTKT